MYFWFYLSFIIYVWHYLFGLKSSKLDKGLENFKRSRNCVTKIPFFFQLDCISSKCLCSSSFLNFLWTLNCSTKLVNHIKCGIIKQISSFLVFHVSYLHTLLAIDQHNVEMVFLIRSRLFRKVVDTTMKSFYILSLK